MSEKSESDYQKMKEFLSFYAERYLNNPNLPPEKRPTAVLEALEKKSEKSAVTGLRQAINDCVEMSFRLNKTEFEKLDAELRDRGFITLSELRRRYSKRYAKIIKRGQIKNETEYYLIRNVFDDPNPKTPEERALLDKMILDYGAG